MFFKGHFRWMIQTPAGRIRTWGEMPNGITTAALNDILDVYFRNDTQLTTWYIGLIRDDNYSALAAADTMASHAGWEEGDEYDEATRPAWSPNAASGQVLQNTSAVEFTINAVQTYKGLFITSDNTIGGTSGVLWATGLFSADQTLQVGETFKVYYELQAREG